MPCGVDEWIHVNCAIWSAEVYEEVSGTLRCVQTAITRGCRLVSPHTTYPHSSYALTPHTPSLVTHPYSSHTLTITYSHITHTLTEV